MHSIVIRWVAAIVVGLLATLGATIAAVWAAEIADATPAVVSTDRPAAMVLAPVADDEAAWLYHDETAGVHYWCTVRFLIAGDAGSTFTACQQAAVYPWGTAGLTPTAVDSGSRFA